MPSLRIQELSPPSAQRELLAVLGLAGLIAGLCGVHVLAVQVPREERVLLPFQRRFLDVGFEQQRSYRALMDALLEAERLRDKTGRWPNAWELAQAGLPPFAPDPLDKEQRAWGSLEDSSGLNYLGWPKDAAGTAFLLLVQEGGESAPLGAPLLEGHHQLGNGALIHVSVWMRPASGERPSQVIDVPNDAGWTQIVLAQGHAPAEETP